MGRSRASFALLLSGCMLSSGAAVQWVHAGEADAAKARPTAAAKPDGHELFIRVWTPGDERSHGGDGLGPVFNESSCVACHNQGGVGGAGPASRNVDILSAVHNAPSAVQHTSLAEQVFGTLFGAGSERPTTQQELEELRKAQIERATEELKAIHPGFLTAGSVVLHTYGTDSGYEAWRDSMSSQMMHGPSVGGERLHAVRNRMRNARFNQNSARMHGSFVLTTTQRNATALFGVGLLDTVSDETLQAAAAQKYEQFPEVNGRVSRQSDDKIGRFGWKAQKVTLRDFTLTACAVELGLNVPGHDQAGVPTDSEYRAAGFDLTQQECRELETFLRELPAPEQYDPEQKREAEYLAEGGKHFAAVGCATCHTPKLGEVAGVYSDLLLHDMGDDLSDTGDYGVFVPNSSDQGDENSDVPPSLITLTQGNPVQNSSSAQADLSKTIGALRTEWRTPPLWGVRDSSPYLHDGRAATLEEAIALHGGEAEHIAQRYFKLEPEERQQMIAFLNSLVAPTVTVTKR